MKIVIDARSLATTPMTGVGYYTLHFLNELAQTHSRYPVDIFLFTSGRTPSPLLRDAISQLPFHHIHISIPNKLLNVWLASGAKPGLESFLPKHDAFWMPNLNFATCNPNFSKYITIHDLSFLHNQRYYSLKNRLRHRLLNVQKLLESSTMLFAVSNHTAADIKRFFPDLHTPVRVIRPGVRSANLSEPSPPFEMPKKFLLYVGTLEPRKNLLGVLEAFRVLRRTHTDLSLILAGQIHNLQTPIRSRIRDESGIRYRSYVSDHEKKALYSNALALLWPSLYEGFGFPPLEAMAYGTPVITSYRTSLPEILKNSAWYVNPYNVAEYVRVVEHILDNPKRGVLAPVYSWTHCVDQTLRAMLETYADRN